MAYTLIPLEEKYYKELTDNFTKGCPGDIFEDSTGIIVLDDEKNIIVGGMVLLGEKYLPHVGLGILEEHRRKGLMTSLLKWFDTLSKPGIVYNVTPPEGYLQPVILRELKNSYISGDKVLYEK